MFKVDFLFLPQEPLGYSRVSPGLAASHTPSSLLLKADEKGQVLKSVGFILTSGPRPITTYRSARKYKASAYMGVSGGGGEVHQVDVTFGTRGSAALPPNRHTIRRHRLQDQAHHRYAKVLMGI